MKNDSATMKQKIEVAMMPGSATARVVESRHDGFEEDDVVLGAPGQVQFTLTVEVPDLGRVFGTAFLEAQCSYGEHTVSATPGEPFGEMEAGTHTTDMVCDLPESPDSVLVSVTNGLDEAHFRGPVE